ncbi:MAG: serine hydrolase [Eubacteriales bacterium]|nr:serine hydrolase [Eubacteriales bacterium]
MKKSLKLLSFIFATIIVLTSQTLTAEAVEFAPPFEVNADAVYIVNMDTGNVIYSKNPDKKLSPASLVKMLTGILTVENLDMQKEITFKFYLQDMLYTQRMNGIGLQTSGLLSGEELNTEKLLHAMLLHSGADAALALADAVGDGSLDYFTELMNKKAQEIGAVNSHFTNCHGLYDPDQYTTARDMYRIADYLMKNDTLKSIVSKTVYEGGPTNIHGADELRWFNTNKLMMKGSTYYYPGVNGVKTGTLSESGYHLVSTCSQDGYEYMAVVMGGPIKDASGKEYELNTAFTETAKLYDWLFTNFKEKTILEKGLEIDEVPVKLSSETDFVKVRTGETFSTLLPVDVKPEDVQLITDLPESIDAPIKEWDKIGEVHLMLKGEELGTVSLLSTQTINRSSLLYMLSWFAQLVTTFAFKFVVTFILVTITMFITLMVVRNYNKRKYRTVKRRRKM